MSKRRRRSFWREMLPHKVAMRILFGHPRNHPKPSDLIKHRVVARIRRDLRTGETKARGVRQATDGRWSERTKRKPASAKVKRERVTAAEQRRNQRAAERTGRRGTQQQGADGTNRNLKRDYQQGTGGRMAGSIRTKQGLPTPRQATGLTRLGCDWCRSSGMRPIYTGEGRIKTVIAVQPCNHRWSSRDGGPSQAPPGRADTLLCQPCANTGTVAVTTISRSGEKLTAEVTCHTCQGWIRHW